MIALAGIARVYEVGGRPIARVHEVVWRPVHALRGIDLDVPDGVAQK